MKKLFILIILIANISQSNAQTSSHLHHGTFKKNKIFMSSKLYKPDEWEKPYYDSCIKTAFPSDLTKFPEKYKDKLIHLIGIVDSVYIEPDDTLTRVTFLVDNKYWDYMEDYSIQDEVMFVSEKGDGKFWVTLYDISSTQLEDLKRFPAEKKIFLVYGRLQEAKNNYPAITAQEIKYIDYELYTTKIYSYEVKRDKQGNVQTDKKGNMQLTNFEFFKVAGKGQNK